MTRNNHDEDKWAEDILKEVSTVESRETEYKDRDYRADTEESVSRYVRNVVNTIAWHF